MLTLKELGNKICIIGCSSSGKSMLADNLSKKLDIPAIHLDFLAHHPNTNWRRRLDSELIAEHNAILQRDKWIIEGNYSVCMQERFEQATSIIWIDSSVLKAAYRYLKRSLIPQHNRIGKLPGSKREFAFRQLKHILFKYPKYRCKYRDMLEKVCIPSIAIHTMTELQQLYKYWEIIY